MILAAVATGAGSLTRIVLAFAIAGVLAALAAHPRVREIERSLGLTVFIASGLPFLLFGSWLTSAGVLRESALVDLQPAYVFGPPGSPRTPVGSWRRRCCEALSVAGCRLPVVGCGVSRGAATSK